MNKHVIKSPKYFKVPGEDRNIGIEATVDGKPLIIPLDEENTLYEQRFTPKNNKLYEKLIKQWTK